MSKDADQLINSVAGEVNEVSSTGKVTGDIHIDFGPGIPVDEAKKRLEDILSRYGGTDNIIIKATKR